MPAKGEGDPLCFCHSRALESRFSAPFGQFGRDQISKLSFEDPMPVSWVLVAAALIVQVIKILCLGAERPTFRASLHFFVERARWERDAQERNLASRQRAAHSSNKDAVPILYRRPRDEFPSALLTSLRCRNRHGRVPPSPKLARGMPNRRELK